MFKNRKERAELLEGLVVSNKDAVVPALPQVRLKLIPLFKIIKLCIYVCMFVF